jgi:group I intron endonuclease
MPSPARMVVYLVTNTVNGKKYVGKTSRTLLWRWGRHISASRRRNDRAVLHKAIRKYGASAFTQEVLSRACNDEALSQLECFWIRELNTRNPRGYNLTDGGEGTVGTKHSPEAKEKIRRAGFGRKHSPETLSKLRGRKCSPETIDRMRAAAVGRRPSPQALEAARAHCTGRKRPPFSDLTRQRLRAAGLLAWARRRQSDAS